MNGEKSGTFRGSDIWIMAAGLATTAGTLLAVYWLSQADKELNIMGWYALFILPAGAFLVGIGAGSGYGLASWLTGRKISGGLLAVILLLLVAAYGTAEWVQFQSLHLTAANGSPVGFFEYYDYTTRHMTLAMGHSRSSTGELGILGYLFRLLALAGFAVGGLIIPLGLKSKPYCERCHSYMRRRKVWWIPASVPDRKIAKKDLAGQQAFAEEMKQALDSAVEWTEKLSAAARERNASTFSSILSEVARDAKSMAKLSRRIQLTLGACPHCSDGVLSAVLHIRQGDKSRSEKLATQSVDSGFTRSLDFRAVRRV